MRPCLKFIEDVLRLAHPLHFYMFGLVRVAAEDSYEYVYGTELLVLLGLFEGFFELFDIF